MYILVADSDIRVPIDRLLATVTTLFDGWSAAQEFAFHREMYSYQLQRVHLPPLPTKIKMPIITPLSVASSGAFAFLNEIHHLRLLSQHIPRLRLCVDAHDAEQLHNRLVQRPPRPRYIDTLKIFSNCLFS